MTDSSWRYSRTDLVQHGDPRDRFTLTFTLDWNKPAMIMAPMFDKVQIMYWSNRFNPYLNDVYYVETIGM